MSITIENYQTKISEIGLANLTNDEKQAHELIIEGSDNFKNISDLKELMDDPDIGGLIKDYFKILEGKKGTARNSVKPPVSDARKSSFEVGSIVRHYTGHGEGGRKYELKLIFKGVKAGKEIYEIKFSPLDSKKEAILGFGDITQMTKYFEWYKKEANIDVKAIRLYEDENNSSNRGTSTRSTSSSSKTAKSGSGSRKRPSGSGSKPKVATKSRGTGVNNRSSAKPKSTSTKRKVSTSKATAKSKATQKKSAKKAVVNRPPIVRNIKSPELMVITRFRNLPKQMRTVESIERFAKQISNASKAGKYVDHKALVEEIQKKLDLLVKAGKKGNYKNLDIVLSEELIEKCNKVVSGASQRLQVNFLAGLEEDWESLPKKVQDILSDMGDDTSYTKAEKVKRKLESMGWTIDYDLSGTLTEVRPLTSYVPAIEMALNELTDISIDLDGEEETIIAGTRFELDDLIDLIADTEISDKEIKSKTNVIITEFMDWAEDLTSTTAKQGINTMKRLAQSFDVKLGK
jgi:hypothetical protein